MSVDVVGSPKPHRGRLTADWKINITKIENSQD